MNYSNIVAGILLRSIPETTVSHVWDNFFFGTSLSYDLEGYLNNLIISGVFTHPSPLPGGAMLLN